MNFDHQWSIFDNNVGREQSLRLDDIVVSRKCMDQGERKPWTWSQLYLESLATRATQALNASKGFTDLASLAEAKMIQK